MLKNLHFPLTVHWSIFALVFLFSSKPNAQNTSYLTLYTQSAFNIKTTDVNLPVGAIAASADVGAMGNASYSIPIAMPPGTNGVAPSLAVVYNSMGGNGSLGQGWGLSGLSAITRTTKSIYFDNETNPVELTANDRFALDGVRLILKTGTYGSSGATYATEAESFATITSNGTQGVGPQWFEVWTKDGVKMEFGNTVDSRFLNHDNTKVIAWKLNKIKYNDGNYIEFKYINASDRDHRIDEINYTGNSVTGLAPYNKIKFNYSIRYDITTTYEVKTPIVSKYLLDNITITA